VGLWPPADWHNLTAAVRFATGGAVAVAVAAAYQRGVIVGAHHAAAAAAPTTTRPAGSDDSSRAFRALPAAVDAAAAPAVPGAGSAPPHAQRAGGAGSAAATSSGCGHGAGAGVRARRRRLRRAAHGGRPAQPGLRRVAGRRRGTGARMQNPTHASGLNPHPDPTGHHARVLTRPLDDRQLGTRFDSHGPMRTVVVVMCRCTMRQ